MSATTSIARGKRRRRCSGDEDAPDDVPSPSRLKRTRPNVSSASSSSVASLNPLHAFQPRPPPRRRPGTSWSPKQLAVWKLLAQRLRYYINQGQLDRMRHYPPDEDASCPLTLATLTELRAKARRGETFVYCLVTPNGRINVFDGIVMAQRFLALDRRTDRDDKTMFIDPSSRQPLSGIDLLRLDRQVALYGHRVTVVDGGLRANELPSVFSRAYDPAHKTYFDEMDGFSAERVQNEGDLEDVEYTAMDHFADLDRRNRQRAEPQPLPRTNLDVFAEKQTELLTELFHGYQHDAAWAAERATSIAAAMGERAVQAGLDRTIEGCAWLAAKYTVLSYSLEYQQRRSSIELGTRPKPTDRTRATTTLQWLRAAHRFDSFAFLLRPRAKSHYIKFVWRVNVAHQAMPWDE